MIDIGHQLGCQPEQLDLTSLCTCLASSQPDSKCNVLGGPDTHDIALMITLPWEIYYLFQYSLSLPRFKGRQFSAQHTEDDLLSLSYNQEDDFLKMLALGYNRINYYISILYGHCFKSQLLWFLIQLLANAVGKAAEDGRSVWVPATHVREQDEAPDS